MTWWGWLLIIGGAIIFLRVFDGVAGRGPKQVSDDIDRARDNEDRVPCPYCAELILPAAVKCRFCQSEIEER